MLYQEWEILILASAFFIAMKHVCFYCEKKNEIAESLISIFVILVNEKQFLLRYLGRRAT